MIRRRPSSSGSCRCCSCRLVVILVGVMLGTTTTTTMGFALQTTATTTTTRNSNTRSPLAVWSLSHNKRGTKRPFQLSGAHHRHRQARSLVLAHGQQLSTLLMLRGGGGAFVVFPSMESLAMPTTVAAAAAYVSVLFLAASNVAFLAAPNFMLQKLHHIQKKPSSSSSSSSVVASNDDEAKAAATVVDDDDDDDIVASTTFLRLTATAGLGVALTLYLSLLQKLSPLVALGWGLVPRLTFFWYLLLLENRVHVNHTRSFGSLQENKRFFIINTILTTWVVASLLLNLGASPTMTAKIFSIMSVIKCSLVVLRPLTVGSKFVGFDVSRKGE
jgi:hypothetical protein